MRPDSSLPSSPLRAEDIEGADHEVLRRLLGDNVPNARRASHSSHASGTGRGHSSYVGSMTPATEVNEQGV